MDSSADKKNRVRGKNFTLCEIEVIKTDVMKNFDIITAKHCNGASPITKIVQDKVWIEITDKVNSIGVCRRSVVDVREKWRNVTKKAKAEVAAQKKFVIKTGGGPPPPLPNPLINDIAELFSQSAAFHGIPGAGDAETAPFLTPALSSSISDLQDTTSGSVDYVYNPATDFEAAIPVNESVERGTVDESLEMNDTSRNEQQNEEVSSNSAKSMKIQRSLKEIQADYFSTAISNMKTKELLLKEQIGLVSSLRELVPKVHEALNVYISSHSKE